MSLATQNFIVERLKQASVFTSVELALGVPDLKKIVILGDAQAWVIELHASPDRNIRDIGSPVQREPQVYAVLIGVRNYNDPTGGNSVQLLESMRLAVRQAVFGLSVGERFDSFTLAGAELLLFEPECIFWVERFQIAHIIDKDNLL